MARLRGPGGAFIPQDAVRPCMRCGKTPDEVRFGYNKGYRHSLCNECRNYDIRQKYNAPGSKRKEAANKSDKARYDKFRALLREYKRMCGCYYCGVTDPASLDFHHNDPAEKSFNLGRIGPSMDRTIAEIRKCTVMCANCHRRITAGEVR